MYYYYDHSITKKVFAHNGYLTWDNDAKLTNGVGSYGSHVRYYWIDSSASSHTSLIGQARSGLIQIVS